MIGILLGVNKMKKLKGGIESIIAVVILAGIVIALIIAVILPMVKTTSQIGEDGKGRMNGLAEQLKPTARP